MDVRLSAKFSNVNGISIAAIADIYVRNGAEKFGCCRLLHTSILEIDEGRTSCRTENCSELFCCFKYNYIKHGCRKCVIVRIHGFMTVIKS